MDEQLLIEVIDGLLRYKQNTIKSTEVFKSMKHNKNLCPAVDKISKSILDCFNKYQKVVYDIQGIGDRGSDILIRFGQKNFDKYIVMQIKSYDDLEKDIYLSKLRLQFDDASDEYGEKSAKLYTMRHTFGTYLYDLTKDIDTVGRKLGHKGLKNVDKYIHVAKDLREQSGKRNLFNQALRSIKARGKADKRDCCKKTHQSPQFPSRRRSGPAHILYAQQEGINEIVYEKSNNLISSIDSFSLNLSFFLFLYKFITRFELYLLNDLEKG